MAKYLLWSIALSMASGMVQADVMRDPTAPFQTPAASAAKASVAVQYHVAAIIFRKSQPAAIVNGQRVAVGSQVEGALVQRIEAHRVLLKTAEGSRWIALSKEPSMKKINQ